MFAFMRAVQISRLDGPGAVEVVDVADPSADNKVLIEVHAAGVDFPVALQTRGLYQYKPELPFTPGNEVAGIVISAPEGSGFAAGDRVAALTPFGGGLAELAAVDATFVFQVPDNVELTAAAGLLFNDLTVHFALRKRAELREGETVLIHGAAGGIGTSALRLAPLLGAGRTIAVVSTEEKAEVARANGATDVVLTDGWLDAVRTLTAGRGVNVVVDPVGGDRFTASLRSLGPGGRLLVIGFTAGEIPTVRVNRLLLNNIDVRGVGWGAWLMTNPGYVREQWAEIEPLLASGRLRAPQPIVHPLDDAAAAIASLEERTAAGKVVLALR